MPQECKSFSFGRPDGQTDVEVGDGRIIFAPVYVGTLAIDGFRPIRGVAVTLLGDEYILGRRILDHGQRIIVRP